MVNAKKLFAFVIMPPRAEFDEFYSDVITPILVDCGYEVERAQTLFDRPNALKQAVLNIYRADLVIADVTLPHAMVLYELGIAQGLLKPSLMISQRIDRLPVDLRSHRVLEYSTHYKKVSEFKGRLRAFVEEHKTGRTSFNNIVMEFLPSLAEAPKLLEDYIEPPIEATMVASPDRETMRSTRPAVYDFALAAVKSMERISSAARHVQEETLLLEQKLGDHIQTIRAIRSRGVSADPKQLREALNRAASTLEAYNASAVDLAPMLHSSWDQLLNSTADLIKVVSIESREDREVAVVFTSQMRTLRLTLDQCNASLEHLHQALNRIPNISKNLNRAAGAAEQIAAEIEKELATGQSYVLSILDLLSERLGSGEQSSRPTDSENKASML
ncbi:MAG: hypothetical protein SNJ59_15000 [Aggregatilineales bacterium]